MSWTHTIIPESGPWGNNCPVVGVKFEQVFYILGIEGSRNICMTCPACRNYKEPKVGKSSGESTGIEATNIWVRILFTSCGTLSVSSNFFISPTPRTFAQLIFWKEVSLPNLVSDMTLFQSIIRFSFSLLIQFSSCSKCFYQGEPWQSLRKVLEEGTS